jgi:hypothetical protein
VVEQRGGWRGARMENILYGSLTQKHRSRAALCATTLRAAFLLAVPSVGSVLTARFGDAPPSPSCPHPKSAAAAPLVVFDQVLKVADRSGLDLRRVRDFAQPHFLADELREFHWVDLNGLLECGMTTREFRHHLFGSPQRAKPSRKPTNVWRSLWRCRGLRRLLRS